MHRLGEVLLPAVVMDLHVRGAENVPTQAACVLAVNHLTMYDVLPIQLALPTRPVFFMAKEELFRNPFTDLLFRSLLAFPVRRGGRDEWAMDFALQLLRNGQMVGIFPEGTRSYGHGLGRGKSGAARLALTAGCPILPMSLSGTHTLFKSVNRRAEINVSIGSALIPQAHEDVDDLTERTMQAIAAMLPDEIQGRYRRANS